MKTPFLNTLRAALLGCAIALAAAPASVAQTDPVARIVETAEDSVTLNALVLYPDTIRRAILVASQYPDALQQIRTMQQSSQTQFTNLLARYRRDDQEAMWNLTRYSGLIDRIVNGGKKRRAQLRTIAADYPDEIRQDVVKYGRRRFNTLADIQRLERTASQSFDATITNYPAEAQEALRTLVSEPEALDILTSNIAMTTRLGEMYKRNPQHIIQLADSLNVEAARRHAREVADWQARLDADPAAKAQLQSAAHTYAEENGYRARDYRRGYRDGFHDSYRMHAYPYWFGYPYWYPYRYWHPRPYWYDWGFHYGPAGQMVVFGYPSFYFTYWYFYYPQHVYYYPDLGHQFVSHYYGHNNTALASNTVVENWLQENNGFFTREFVQSETVRREQIRDLGRLQRDALVTGASSPRQVLAQAPDRYPALNRDIAADVTPRERSEWFRETPAQQPPVRTLPREEGRTAQPGVTQQPRVQPQPRSERQAPEYHQRQWDRQQPPVIRQPQQAPQPQQQPRVQPQQPQPRQAQPAPQPRIRDHVQPRSN